MSIKKAEYIADGQRVVEELKQLILKQIIQKRKPNRKYKRWTKQGNYRKYK